MTSFGLTLRGAMVLHIPNCGITYEDLYYEDIT